MSVRRDGDQYEVRWRDADGTHRARRFPNRHDAERFDQAIQAWMAKRRGDDAWDRVPPSVRKWAQRFPELNDT